MGPTIAYILEIGDHDYFKRQYSNHTTLLWTGRKRSANVDRGVYQDCTSRRLLQTLSDAADGHLDVIVTYSSPR